MQTKNKVKPLAERQVLKIKRTINTCTTVNELESSKRLIDNFANMYRANPKTPFIVAFLEGYLECKTKNI